MTDQTTTTLERTPRDAWRDDYHGRLADAAAGRLGMERPQTPAPADPPAERPRDESPEVTR